MFTNCEATQPLSSCTMAVSVRSVHIAIKQDENQQPVWLTTFKPILEEMLDIAQRKISIRSPEEDIYSHLFRLSNFSLQDSDTCHVIKNISV